MSINHPGRWQHTDEDDAFIFAELGGFTCSICAPLAWDKERIEGFAEANRPGGPSLPWVAVNKADLGLGGETPNPCNWEPKLRQHWFLLRGTLQQ